MSFWPLRSRPSAGASSGTSPKRLHSGTSTVIALTGIATCGSSASAMSG
ncbi:MAG: hypothetical protein U0237_01865 [Thermoleophilia bacterium]